MGAELEVKVMTEHEIYQIDLGVGLTSSLAHFALFSLQGGRAALRKARLFSVLKLSLIFFCRSMNTWLGQVVG